MDGTSLKASTLYAIHKHMAVKCKACNKAWFDCKEKNEDPKECLAAGADVIHCVNKLCEYNILFA